MQAPGRSVAAVAIAALLGVALPCSGQNAGGDDTLGSCRALLQEGHPGPAVPLLEVFVTEHHASVAGTCLLAYASYAAKQPRLSLEVYTRAASLRAPSAEDFMAISTVYILLKDYTDAAKWLATVTTMQPTNGLAWYYLGRALHLNGRYPEALEVFAHALALQPRTSICSLE